MMIWDSEWLMKLGVTKEVAELMIIRGAKDPNYIPGFLKYIGFPPSIYLNIDQRCQK